MQSCNVGRLRRLRCCPLALRAPKPLLTNSVFSAVCNFFAEASARPRSSGFLAVGLLLQPSGSRESRRENGCSEPRGEVISIEEHARTELARSLAVERPLHDAPQFIAADHWPTHTEWGSWSRQSALEPRRAHH